MWSKLPQNSISQDQISWWVCPTSISFSMHFTQSHCLSLKPHSLLLGAIFLQILWTGILYLHINLQFKHCFVVAISLWILPYCVNMLLLTSTCKSLPTILVIQGLVINWCLHKTFKENVLLKVELMLYRSLLITYVVKGLLKVIM